MKKVFSKIVPVVALAAGCQSGLYKVSTSEDDKSIDSSIRYYEVTKGSDSFSAEFIKDNGSSPDGVLYDEDRMPIEIVEGRSYKEPDKPGWSGVLWMFTLGIFPMCQSEYMTQNVTVKSPIGERSGSYRVDAKRWIGWIPLFVGYPSSADERDSEAKLPNSRIEGMAKDRLVKSLVGEFSYKSYNAFAKAKNDERKAEITRIKDVSKNVDDFLSKNKFDDAISLIGVESKSRSATQHCDKKEWAEMRERVTVAHQNYDKTHVKSLIANGKYEDAIAFCDARNALPDSMRTELKNESVNKAVKELNDAKRLVAFLELITDAGLRDDVVMKLKNLKSLTLLNKGQLVGIANTSSREDIILAILEAVDDKTTLVTLLDKKRSATVFKAILEKIADADAVRSKVWNKGTEEELFCYVSVYGSDDECMKLIKLYPNLLTDNVIKELKPKISKGETKAAVDELQTNRLVAEIASLKGDKAIARIKAISDVAIRSKMAKRVLDKIDKKSEKTCCDWKVKPKLTQCSNLVALMTKDDVDTEAKRILKDCEKRIHFEGFYIGMPVQEYYVMKAYHGDGPTFIYSEDGLLGWSTWYYADMSKLSFNRTFRYRLFEKEDGEFWSAFMRKYIPAGKKKSLTEAIGDALDSGTYSYQESYEGFTYKSMKYGTKVTFNKESGDLVLEAYK